MKNGRRFFVITAALAIVSLAPPAATPTAGTPAGSSAGGAQGAQAGTGAAAPAPGPRFDVPGGSGGLTPDQALLAELLAGDDLGIPGSPINWGDPPPRQGLTFDLGDGGLLRANHTERQNVSKPLLDSKYFLEETWRDHEIKFGVDYYTADAYADDLTPNQRIAYVYGNDPSPALGGGILGPTSDYHLDQSFSRISGYIQDTITFGKLTANSGYRYDTESPLPSEGIFGDPAVDVFGGSITPNFDVPAAWELISPRLSLSYDITGDGKNVLTLSADRYMSQSGNSLASNYVPYRSGFMYWYDNAPSTGSDPGARFDPYDAALRGNTLNQPLEFDDNTGYNTPYLDELMLMFEKALTDDLAVSLTGFYKEKHNLAFDTMVERPTTIGDPATDTVVPIELVELDLVSPDPIEVGGFDAPFPVDLTQPGVFDPISNGRNPLVQIMVIDNFGNVIAHVNVGGAPTQAPAPVTLWSALTRLFVPDVATPGGGLVPIGKGGSTPMLTGSVGWGTAEGFARPTMPPRRREPAAPIVPVVQQSANGLQVFLTNLGNSSGEAFVMQAFNAGTAPLELFGEGLVVEPLKEELQRQVQQQLQQQLSRLIGDNPVTQTLNAYCLEFFKAPPSPDSMFQIASGALQEQFAPLKHVMSASKQLQDLGLLNPDSDPLGYFHSIRQWSVWTKEEDFDESAFTDAFVDHTRKQVEDAGQAWSAQFDSSLRNAAPNRWNDIQRVLNEAGRLEQSGAGR